MQLFSKTLIASLLGILIHTSALAIDDAQINRYEQAKLRLTYDGSLGNLLQQLSQRLKVGFIAYDVDISHQVTVKNETETSIKTIYQQLENQLPDIDIRFDKIGERLFLMVSNKNAAPLLNNVAKPEQVVGDIVFEGDEKTQAPAAVSTTETTPSSTTVAPQPEAATATNENTDHFKQIFAIATNKETLMAVKDKKTPQYKIVTKERLGLQNIRVTPLGTFLVFDSKVDVSQFKVKGIFEDMAQTENMVAILHREKTAPTRIEIEDSQGLKLILETPQAVANKKSKAKK